MTIGDVRLDVRSMLPIHQMKGESEFETRLLLSYVDEACMWLSGYTWCTEIRERLFGVGVGGVIAVFLIEVVVKSVDLEWLWVVVGDLPPAYFARSHAGSPCEALLFYCNLVEQWADAVGREPSGRDLFRFRVDATAEVAAMLTSKVETLRRIVIPALCPPDIGP
jgi:hypothetical protein